MKAGVPFSSSAHMMHAPKCEGGLASFSFVSLALQSTTTELLMRLLSVGVEGKVCRARYVAARANHDWLTDGKTRAGPRFHFIRTCAARLRRMGYILSDVDSSHAVQEEFCDRLRVVDGVSDMALVHELEAKGFQFMDELMDGEDLRPYALIRKGGVADKPSAWYSRLRELLSGSIRAIRAVEERPTLPSVGGVEVVDMSPHKDNPASQREARSPLNDEVVPSESSIRLAVHGRHMAARALRAQRRGQDIPAELPFEGQVNTSLPHSEVKEEDSASAVFSPHHLALE